MAQVLAQGAASLPAFVADAPMPEPEAGLFWTAFWQLGTCRRWRSAPVPWDACQLWATAHGLSEGDTADLHAIVRAIDARYLELQARADAAEREKARADADNRPRR